MLPDPKVRNVRQRYLMFLAESPIHDTFPYEQFPGFFNWTMTYRFDDFGLVNDKMNFFALLVEWEPLNVIKANVISRLMFSYLHSLIEYWVKISKSVVIIII